MKEIVQPTQDAHKSVSYKLSCVPSLKAEVDNSVFYIKRETAAQHMMAIQQVSQPDLLEEIEQRASNWQKIGVQTR